MRTVVLARNHGQATSWRIDQGLGPRDIIEASSPQVLHGLRDFDRVVELPGFAERRDAAGIIETVTLAVRYARHEVTWTVPPRLR